MSDEHEAGAVLYVETLASFTPTPSFTITPRLRWRNGVLEQMWQGDNGDQKWEPVPVEDGA